MTPTQSESLLFRLQSSEFSNKVLHLRHTLQVLCSSIVSFQPSGKFTQPRPDDSKVEITNVREQFVAGGEMVFSFLRGCRTRIENLWLDFDMCCC